MTIHVFVYRGIEARRATIACDASLMESAVDDPRAANCRKCLSLIAAHDFPGKGEPLRPFLFRSSE